MDLSHFNGAVGVKFYSDGRPCPFPGNTIISKIDARMMVRFHLRHLAELLRQVEGPPLALLPGDSWHMTVMEGLCDAVRRPGYWTDRLPPDAPLADVDEVMYAAAAEAAPLPPTIMRLDRVAFGNCVTVALDPQGARDAENLKRYRDEVSARSGVRFPGHDDYRFHITLAYGLALPDETQAEALAAFERRANTYLAAEDARFNLASPVFTWFDDMLAFSETPLVRG